MAALLLLGGVALDLDRVMAARATLDRLATEAAIAAAVAQGPSERQRICRNRFKAGIWTERDVRLKDVTASLDIEAGERFSTVEWDATVKLAVGRFFGLPEIAIEGETEVPAPAAGERVALVSP
jgi:hypothetical protein